MKNQTPLLLALTFLLGCLVTLLLLDGRRAPAHAQSSSVAGEGQIANLTVTTLQIGQGQSVLVVFKEVNNILMKEPAKPDPKAKPLDPKQKLDTGDRITCMAVYNIVGLREIVLIGTRFIDYDLQQYEYKSPNSAKGPSVDQMKALFEKNWE